MHLQTPTHRRLVVVLAGVIFAMRCEIGIDGDTICTNNSAVNDGGEKRGTWIALKTLLITTTVVLASKRVLFSSC